MMDKSFETSQWGIVIVAIWCFTLTQVVFAQKMTVKDDAGNVLMEVNDEGTEGSILLPSMAGAPGVTANKLYNVGGVLYWNGSMLGGGDFSDGGDTAGADRTLGNNDNYDLGFETNGSTRLHIENDGDVGIGTDAPNNRLEVRDASGVDEGIAEFTETTTNISLLIRGNSSIADLAAKHIELMGTSVASDLALSPSTGSRGAVVIKDGGDVGIGTPTPNQQLEITENFRLPATTATTGIIYSDGDVFMHRFGSNNYFAGAGAGNLTLAGAIRSTGIGAAALAGITDGDENTAVGYQALLANTGGDRNTAVGKNALSSVTDGQRNTAVGRHALTANTGNSNTALGNGAGASLTTGSNNICIDHAGVAGESATIRIGTSGTQNKAFVAGIRGVTTGNANAVTVLIDSDGQLGTVSSSRRFKRDIRNIGEVSHGLMDLRPVQFTYKSDASETTQYGLIAEEVADVCPELVVYGKDGRVETVKYHLLSTLLLNEVQRLNKKIEALESCLENEE